MILGYNELGYNEHLVIMNRFLSQIDYFSTQINPVKTDPGYNEKNGRSRAVRFI